MDAVEGAQTFQVAGSAYDGFMGRYSTPLASRFAAVSGVVRGQSVLDLGCGPGALTGVLAALLGPGSVGACDPSPPFVAACRERNPGVEVRPGRAEAIPFDDDSFDGALAQLVLHFVSDPGQAMAELQRVVRPGGTVAACVWDFAGGMEMLRRFWDAALAVDTDAPDEASTLRFGRAGEIASLFEEAGFVDIAESTIEVESTYSGFEELWSGFQAGIGPAGSYCVSLPDDQQLALRQELFRLLNSPTGPFTLAAAARYSVARTAVS